MRQLAITRNTSRLFQLLLWVSFFSALITMSTWSRWEQFGIQLPPSLAHLGANLDLAFNVFDANLDCIVGIVAMCWLYRVNTLLKLRGATLLFSPWQCVLAFIVPVRNLWRPLWALKEIMHGSRLTPLAFESIENVEDEKILRRWQAGWLLFLITICLYLLRNTGLWLTESFPTAVGEAIEPALRLVWVVMNPVAALFSLTCLSVVQRVQANLDTILAPESKGAGRSDWMLSCLSVWLSVAGVAAWLHLPFNAADTSAAELAICQQLFGANSDAMQALACRWGDYFIRIESAAQAEKPYIRVLEISGRKGFASVESALQRLRNCYRCQGKFADMLTVSKQLAQKSESALGVNNARTGTAVAWVAYSAYQVGNLDEAELYAQRALAIAQVSGTAQTVRQYRINLAEIIRTRQTRAPRLQP